MKELAKRLNDLCDPLPFHTSWYLKDLASGEKADRMGDVPVPSASVAWMRVMGVKSSAAVKVCFVMPRPWLTGTISHCWFVAPVQVD